MSTRSYILIETKEKKYKGIYCHCDGYLEYNGLILNDCYKDREKVENLINLGDLSSLHSKLEDCQTYGESAHFVEIEDLLKDFCIEHIYIYKLDNEWYHITTWVDFPKDTHNFRLLKNEIANLEKTKAEEIETRRKQYCQLN